MDQRREEFRSELTQLLTHAHNELALQDVALSEWVMECIDNYEFGLAYETIIEELNEHGIRPEGDAAKSWAAAAAIMGFNSN